MKTPPRRSSDRDSFTSEIPSPTTSNSQTGENGEGNPQGFPSFSDSEAPFDPAALDFLPAEDGPVFFPPIETEIGADGSLSERLDALSSSGDGGGKDLFKKPPLTESFLFFLVSKRGISFLFSILIHLLILIGLAVWVFGLKTGKYGVPLQAGFSDEEEISLTETAGEDIEAADLDFSGPSVPDQITEYLPQDLKSEQLISGDAELTPEPKENQTVENIGIDADGAGLFESMVVTGKATSGRNAETRKHGLPGREGDTTDKSEDAVEAGLAWLAEHQLSDGGWSFDLTEPGNDGRPGNCGGLCSNCAATSGAMVARNGLYPSRAAATGIALLAFLGAGYDHQSPNHYQKTVAAGLNFLQYQARHTESGIDFRSEGDKYGMYTQAIVAVTLCEAYELTEDPQLKAQARDSILFIAKSQRDDGGWRYEAAVDPNFFSYAPGDTSVTGWQMLALKSAVSAGIEIPPEIFYKVSAFLDTVQSEENTLYRYMAVTNESETKLRGTTAVGFLVREYLGWGPNRKEMKRGAQNIIGWFDEMNAAWKRAKRGENETENGTPIFRDERYIYNLYFAYYGTIALHHFGGKKWHRTFAKTRDFLVETQNNGRRIPHERGSWLFYDRYLNDGGRLLNTAVAVLILETPYRYLPMYK